MHNNYSWERPYGHMFEVFKEIFEDAGQVRGKSFSVELVEVPHAQELQIREEQKETFDNTNLDNLMRLHAYLNIMTPMNYTLRWGPDIMLIASVFPQTESVCEISFLVDKKFVESPLAVRLAVIKAFKRCIDSLPFYRKQAKVKSTFEIGQRFVESMGLTKEGIMRKFGPDRADYIMYALVQEED